MERYQQKENSEVFADNDDEDAINEGIGPDSDFHSNLASRKSHYANMNFVKEVDETGNEGSSLNGDIMSLSFLLSSSTCAEDKDESIEGSRSDDNLNFNEGVRICNSASTKLDGGNSISSSSLAVSDLKLRRIDATREDRDERRDENDHLESPFNPKKNGNQISQRNATFLHNCHSSSSIESRSQSSTSEATGSPVGIQEQATMKGMNTNTSTNNDMEGHFASSMVAAIKPNLPANIWGAPDGSSSFFGGNTLSTPVSAEGNSFEKLSTDLDPKDGFEMVHSMLEQPGSMLASELSHLSLEIENEKVEPRNEASIYQYLNDITTTDNSQGTSVFDNQSLKQTNETSKAVEKSPEKVTSISNSSSSSKFSSTLRSSAPEFIVSKFANNTNPYVHTSTNASSTNSSVNYFPSTTRPADSLKTDDLSLTSMFSKENTCFDGKRGGCKDHEIRQEEVDFSMAAKKNPDRSRHSASAAWERQNSTQVGLHYTPLSAPQKVNVHKDASIVNDEVSSPKTASANMALSISIGDWSTVSFSTNKTVGVSNANHRPPPGFVSPINTRSVGTTTFFSSDSFSSPYSTKSLPDQYTSLEGRNLFSKNADIDNTSRSLDTSRSSGVTYLSSSSFRDSIGATNKFGNELGDGRNNLHNRSQTYTYDRRKNMSYHLPHLKGSNGNARGDGSTFLNDHRRDKTAFGGNNSVGNNTIMDMKHGGAYGHFILRSGGVQDCMSASINRVGTGKADPDDASILQTQGGEMKGNRGNKKAGRQKQIIRNSNCSGSLSPSSKRQVGLRPAMVESMLPNGCSPPFRSNFEKHVKSEEGKDFSSCGINGIKNSDARNSHQTISRRDSGTLDVSSIKSESIKNGNFSAEDMPQSWYHLQQVSGDNPASWLPESSSSALQMVGRMQGGPNQSHGDGSIESASIFSDLTDGGRLSTKKSSRKKITSNMKENTPEVIKNSSDSWPILPKYDPEPSISSDDQCWSENSSDNGDDTKETAFQDFLGERNSEKGSFSFSACVGERKGSSRKNKKLDYLLRMKDKIAETPIGNLDPNVIPITNLMNDWAKTKCNQGATMVQNLLNRIELEFEVGNSHPEIEPTTKMYTMAVDAWAKSGEGEKAAQQAEAILQHMYGVYQSGIYDSLKPTTGIFNAVINSWARSNSKIAPLRAEQILVWMEELHRSGNLDVKPDKYTFNTVIHAWAKSGGKEAAARAQKILDNMHTMYREGNSLAKPDAITYNVVINSWAKSGDKCAALEAERLLSKMYTQYESGNLDVKPNVVTYGAVIDAYAKSLEPEAASRADTILANMIRLYQDDPVNNADLRPNTYVFNTVINCWAKSKDEDAASKAEEMLVAMGTLSDNGIPGLKPDAFTYTAVIDAWAKSGYRGAAARADELLNKMESKYLAGDTDLKPNTFTYNAVINALAKSGEAGAAGRAERVLENMVNRYRTGSTEDVKPTTINFNTVLDAWAKSGGGRAAAERAEKILEWMDELYKSGNAEVKPDTITFNAVIDAWARSGDRRAPERAEQILYHMDDLYRYGNKGIKPDSYTYNTLINAWAKSGEEGAAHRAELILAVMERKYQEGDTSLKPNTRTHTSVIDAWAKSGEPKAAQKAEQILVTMQALYENSMDPETRPNTHTANAVMNACAFTKLNEDRPEALSIAFRVFDWLSKQKYTHPDSYTFNIMLSVCSNLLPRQDGETRFAHASELFLKCCDAGHVNDFVLRKLRQTVTEEEYLRLVRYRRDSSAADMPKSWTRNAKLHTSGSSRNRKSSKWSKGRGR